MLRCQLVHALVDSVKPGLSEVWINQCQESYYSNALNATSPIVVCSTDSDRHLTDIYQPVPVCCTTLHSSCRWCSNLYSAANWKLLLLWPNDSAEVYWLVIHSGIKICSRGCCRLETFFFSIFVSLILVGFIEWRKPRPCCVYSCILMELRSVICWHVRCMCRVNIRDNRMICCFLGEIGNLNPCPWHINKDLEVGLAPSDCLLYSRVGRPKFFNLLE